MTVAANQSRPDAAVGQETRLERFLNKHVSSGVHLFLSFLAALVFAAAIVATFSLLTQAFPRLWIATDEYAALQVFIHDALLIAIAAELALLLLFHRTSAAIEVIIFVIARKMSSPELAGVDMILGALALTLLVVVRVYLLPGRPKAASSNANA